MNTGKIYNSAFLAEVREEFEALVEDVKDIIYQAGGEVSLSTLIASLRISISYPRLYFTKSKRRWKVRGSRTDFENLLTELRFNVRRVSNKTIVSERR